mmetsp:Transcript_73746/g.118963  ORF Transcript_73746/g.118963 Transcript_73746/m.118963 type:complete len:348 (-) Transcript_73746:759-1802(-)
MARDLRNVLVEGHLTGRRPGTANSHRHGKDRIGAQLGLAPAPLILCPVQLLHHQLVDLVLLPDIHSYEPGGDDVVDIGHCFEHALAQEPRLVAISELQSLVDPRRGATWHGRAEERRFRADVHLHGGVASGVEDLARPDLHNLRGNSATRPSWCVVQGRDTWKVLTLEKLKRGSTSSAAVRDFVLCVVLLAGRGGVPTTNHCHAARLCDLDDLIHHSLGAILEGLHLEDPHRPVPDDGLRLGDAGRIQGDGLRAAIEAHEARRNALAQFGLPDLTILTKLRGDDKVHWQHDLHTFCLCLLHDLRHQLGSFLIEERVTNLNTIYDLDESEGHAATDHHAVDLVQHVLD